MDIGETFLDKLLRHPGAGIFIGSGTVENEGLVLAIALHRRAVVIFVKPLGALDLKFTGTPVPARSNIENDEVGRAQHRLQLVFVHLFN